MMSAIYDKFLKLTEIMQDMAQAGKRKDKAAIEAGGLRMSELTTDILKIAAEQDARIVELEAEVKRLQQAARALHSNNRLKDEGSKIICPHCTGWVNRISYMLDHWPFPHDEGCIMSEFSPEEAQS